MKLRRIKTLRVKRKPKRILLNKRRCFSCDKTIHTASSRKFVFCSSCQKRLSTKGSLSKRECFLCGKKKQLTTLIEHTGWCCDECGIKEFQEALFQAVQMQSIKKAVEAKKAARLARRMVKKGFKKAEVKGGIRDLFKSFGRTDEDWVKKQAKRLYKRAKKGRG